jgi:uncharacterized protein YpmB
MPPRRTRKKSAAPRCAAKGNKSAFWVALLIFFIVLSGAGFYLLNQERDKHQSVEAKAHKIAKENPDAEVFMGDANSDANVKKKQ